jgi:hypothetical protein
MAGDSRITDAEPIELTKPPEREVRLHVGARDGKVVLSVGGPTVLLDPAVADQISLSLQRFALEARNGGRLT